MGRIRVGLLFTLVAVLVFLALLWAQPGAPPAGAPPDGAAAGLWRQLVGSRAAVSTAILAALAAYLKSLSDLTQFNLYFTSQLQDTRTIATIKRLGGFISEDPSDVSRLTKLGVFVTADQLRVVEEWLRRHDGDLADVGNQVKQHGKDLGAADARLERHDRKLNPIDPHLRRHDGEIEEIKGLVRQGAAGTADKLQALEAWLRRHDAEHGEARSRLERSAEQRDAVSARLKRHGEELDAGHRHLQVHDVAIAEFRTRLEHLERALRDLRGQLDRLPRFVTADQFGSQLARIEDTLMQMSTSLEKRKPADLEMLLGDAEAFLLEVQRLREKEAQ